MVCVMNLVEDCTFIPSTYWWLTKRQKRQVSFLSYLFTFYTEEAGFFSFLFFYFLHWRFRSGSTNWSEFWFYNTNSYVSTQASLLLRCLLSMISINDSLSSVTHNLPEYGQFLQYNINYCGTVCLVDFTVLIVVLVSSKNQAKVI